MNGDESDSESDKIEVQYKSKTIKQQTSMSLCCPFCDKSDEQSSNLMVHIWSVHLNIWKY